MPLPQSIRRLLAACLAVCLACAALHTALAEPAPSGERQGSRTRGGSFPGRQQSYEAPADEPGAGPRRAAAEDETSHSLPKPGVASADRSSKSGWGAFFSVVTSLTIVIGLFGGVAWLLRQNLPGGTRTLPKEVFENLGRAPLAGRQQVCLLRCGRQLLLAATSPGNVEPLMTIDQPEEVERLVALCKQKDPHSASGTFDRVLRQLTRETKTPELNEPRREPQVRSLRRAGTAEGDHV